eukprot:scaffold45309_cov16-Tisochrysis_lutea.AAC.1
MLSICPASRPVPESMLSALHGPDCVLSPLCVLHLRKLLKDLWRPSKRWDDNASAIAGGARNLLEQLVRVRGVTLCTWQAFYFQSLDRSFLENPGSPDQVLHFKQSTVEQYSRRDLSLMHAARLDLRSFSFAFTTEKDNTLIFVSRARSSLACTYCRLGRLQETKAESLVICLRCQLSSKETAETENAGGEKTNLHALTEHSEEKVHCAPCYRICSRSQRSLASPPSPSSRTSRTAPAKLVQKPISQKSLARCLWAHIQSAYAGAGKGAGDAVPGSTPACDSSAHPGHMDSTLKLPKMSFRQMCDAVDAWVQAQLQLKQRPPTYT